MNANRIMGGGPAFQKGIADKPNMKTTQILKRLWKYLYHFKWFLFLALFMTLTSNILALTGPMLSGMAFDAPQPEDRPADAFGRIPPSDDSPGQFF